MLAGDGLPGAAVSQPGLKTDPREEMIRRIAEEEWRVGDQLLPENTLAELYQISRITTRQWESPGR